MDHNLLMLECLKLATNQGFKGADARKEAQTMFNQILGRSTGEELQNDKVKVVGRDGDIDPKFKDYLKE